MFLYHCLKHLNLPRLAIGVKPGINRNNNRTLAPPIAALCLRCSDVCLWGKGGRKPGSPLRTVRSQTAVIQFCITLVDRAVRSDVKDLTYGLDCCKREPY